MKRKHTIAAAAVTALAALLLTLAANAAPICAAQTSPLARAVCETVVGAAQERLAADAGTP
jgi:uncharacterized membrane protein